MPGDIDGADGPRPNARPIFVLGVLPRSGTNFLADLLCLHPDCGPPEPVWEDYFVHHADLLDRYVTRVCEHWTPSWGVSDDLRDRLFAHLGSGLTSFLAERSGAVRTVTKTPRVENLERFFRLFPDAHLLILVRDGRAVLESGIRTFGWNRESAVHKWAEAADRILRFDSEHRGSNLNYRIVKYEDLWTDLESRVREILEFLGLDADVYDFRAAAELPVRGSSTVGGRRGDVHWKPVARGANFDPLSRFRHWSGARHARFNWVAGRYLEQLGYEPERNVGVGIVSTVRNLLLDLWWVVLRTLGPLCIRLRNRQTPGADPSVADSSPDPAGDT